MPQPAVRERLSKQLLIGKARGQTLGEVESAADKRFQQETAPALAGRLLAFLDDAMHMCWWSTSSCCIVSVCGVQYMHMLTRMHTHIVILKIRQVLWM